MPKELPFTLGADPEFAIRKKGIHINASQVFSSRGGYLGTDVETTGEVRPGVANDPDELIARLYTCFKSKSKSLDKDLSFHAGHFFDGLPLGGHLHCGVDLPETSKGQTPLWFTIEFYLMCCLSELIDDQEGYKKRSTLTSYGRKSHEGKRIISTNPIEIKGYGGYEYRTPGSWLISPAVAFANVTLFALANLIFKKYGQKCYDILPDPTTLSPEQKVSEIANINKHVDIPKCCEAGLEFTNLLLADRESIDWQSNFRNEWQF